MGCRGVKIDFIKHDNQAKINFYNRCAANAAAHHLMVDFHGSTKPSGLERTWPNILGYEAVAGVEQSKGVENIKFVPQVAPEVALAKTTPLMVSPPALRL